MVEGKFISRAQRIHTWKRFLKTKISIIHKNHLVFNLWTFRHVDVTLSYEIQSLHATFEYSQCQCLKSITINKNESLQCFCAHSFWSTAYNWIILFLCVAYRQDKVWIENCKKIYSVFFSNRLYYSTGVGINNRNKIFRNFENKLVKAASKIYFISNMFFHKTKFERIHLV